MEQNADALRANIAELEERSEAAVGKANKKLRTELRNQIWALREQLEACDTQVTSTLAVEKEIHTLFKKKVVPPYEIENSEAACEFCRRAPSLTTLLMPTSQ